MPITSNQILYCEYFISVIAGCGVLSGLTQSFMQRFSLDVYLWSYSPPKIQCLLQPFPISRMQSQLIARERTVCAEIMLNWLQTRRQCDFQQYLTNSSLSRSVLLRRIILLLINFIQLRLK